MSTIAAGASATLTVTDGATVTLSSGPTDSARLTIATGANAGRVVIAQHAGRKRYGPFGAGTLTLQAVSGYCTYYISTDGADDSERVITSVTLDSDDLTGLNTAGKPIPKGVFLKDPTTKLVYGQSDGAGSYEALGAGGSSSVTVGGGGDDVTAWGGFTGGLSGNLPTSVTVNGVTQTIAYVAGTDNVESYTIALNGADDIVTLIGYDNGYSEASGNIIRGGAITMTLPQLRYLRDEVLISAGALATGFRARVEGASDTDALAYVVDTSGTKSYRSCVLEWDGAMLSPLEGVSRHVYQTATHVNSSAESSALATVVFPGWLVKPGCDLVCETMHTATGGTSSTLTARLKVNGTEFGNGVGSAGGSPSSTIQQNLRALGSASQIAPNSSAGQTGSHSASSSGANTASINTETTDFTITTTTQMSVADKTATMQYLRVSLERR